jgi:hypothetical protein
MIGWHSNHTVDKKRGGTKLTGCQLEVQLRRAAKIVTGITREGRAGMQESQ